MTSYSSYFFTEVAAVTHTMNYDDIELMADALADVRAREGRLFFLGVGGSAGNCSHAVNDFRKLCSIEAYAPTDNVSELTARTNDEGWETVFVEWLKVSNITSRDAIFILSVGGGDSEKNISSNLIYAIDYARYKSAKIFGIVGRENGYTALNGDLVIVVPTVNKELVTPLSESFQVMIWHSLVSNPKLKRKPTKWEQDIPIPHATVYA